MSFSRLTFNLGKTISSTLTTAATTTTTKNFVKRFATSENPLPDLQNCTYNAFTSKGFNNPYFYFCNDNSCVFRFDMPGIRNSYLRCNVEGSKIKFSAQEPKTHRFVSGHCEARYYEVKVEADPTVYNVEQVNAEVKNGVLWVVVPRFRAGPMGWFSFTVAGRKNKVNFVGDTLEVYLVKDD